MHSESNKIEFMIYDNADEVIIKELFEYIFNRYQIGLKTSISGSGFTFHCVHLLCYKCH